jgi:polyisoprenoid-binding protein YceI
MLKSAAAAFITILSAATVHADELSDVAGRYRVLASSHIHFSVAQAGGASIEGEFRQFKGMFQIDRAIGRSKVEFSLQPASVTAADPRIEEFIKSEPVFDVAKHPTVSFRSTGVTRTGGDSARIDGQLSAKGVTRPTKFSITFEGQHGKVLKFHVTGKLSRAMFNMDVGTPIYSNMVVLDMDLVGQKM